MGGVKELFKDEKQIKNLDTRKMGKVKKQNYPKNISIFIISGVPVNGKGNGPANAESDRWDAGDREHDEADAGGRLRDAGRDEHARTRADDEEERRKKVITCIFLQS